MLYLLRHLVSLAILPGTALVLVPVWVARRYNIRAEWPDSIVEWFLVGAGIVVATPGVILFAASLQQFFTKGEGTLAPWDPPRALVGVGLYRYVRNPMYLSVTAIVLGEVLLTRSRELLLYWVVWFFVANVFVRVYEEPTLRRQFGADYEDYARRVGRWLPKLRRRTP